MLLMQQQKQKTNGADMPKEEQKIIKVTAETFGTEYPEPEMC